LVVLDEMSMALGKVVDKTTYMIAGGKGKMRANTSGNAAPTKEWQLVVLSSGEVTVEEHLRKDQIKINAGQEVRMIDIPMDTSMFGGFEELHNYSDAGSFSDAVTNASADYYGHAYRDFIKSIQEAPDKAVAAIKEISADFIEEYVPKDASSQVKRAAKFFSYVAAAGELATAAGITGWGQNEAINEAAICLKAWMDHRGGLGNSEAKRAIKTIKVFIQTHGQSRFIPWSTNPVDDENKPYTEKWPNCFGFKKTLKGAAFYYFYREQFETEFCCNNDKNWLLDLLKEKGVLEFDRSGRDISRKPKALGSSQRFYCISENILDIE